MATPNNLFYTVFAPDGNLIAAMDDYTDAVAVIAGQGSMYLDAVYAIHRQSNLFEFMSVRDAREHHPTITGR